MIITIPIVYIAVSFFFGYLGRNRKMGFWGYFFATFFLTPFIGAILLIVSGKKESDEEKEERISKKVGTLINKKLDNMIDKEKTKKDNSGEEM